MIDFLKKCGISKNVISEIEKANVDTNIYNLSCNEYNACLIIKFLKELGINCIDELLINKIELFFCTFNDVKDAFYKYDLYKLVEMINQDYNIIDIIKI